jgi:ubiquinone/menaquinone biosynthesis C-methylase UbiE
MEAGVMDQQTKESLRIWDGVAEGWDRYREEINAQERPVTDRMIDALGVRSGDTILELCAGPGSVGLQVAERYPDAKVLITDFSPHMVEAAGRAAKDGGLSNVDVREMDAQSIELADESVDGVLSRFGLMIPPDRTKVFSEIRRVLKPGRVLTYVTWGPIPNNAWMALLGAPLMARGLFDPPPEGMPLSTDEENRAIATATGFTTIETATFDEPMTFETFDDYWDVNTAVGGPVAEIVRKLPTDQRKEIHDQVEEFAAGFKTDSGYALPAQRMFVKAY